MSKQVQLVRADGLRLDATENFNLGPMLPNREYRDRDWLEPGEVAAMIQAVRRYAARHPRAKRFAHRDEAIILLTWRHGLRISGALELKWQSINLTTGHVMVLRCKGSIDGRHPMERDEVHLLKNLSVEYPEDRYAFNNHHGGSMGYSAMRHVIVRAAELAGLPFRISPHVLRHTCGYALANKGVDTRTTQDSMGHANIQNTVGYTRLNASRFEGIWR